MNQDQTKKEALFNEVKGSLFEYLVARELAIAGRDELSFQKSLDKNYLTVLAQQDRMVRQFYPEMFKFLTSAGKASGKALLEYYKEAPTKVKVVGKFSNSIQAEDLHEADLVLNFGEKISPVSLKLNKKNAFVNTKSGGIKSFFKSYFSYIDPEIQEKFNSFVDFEFNRMANDLHSHHDMIFDGNWSKWVKTGLSELPGELDQESRLILKNYYARIAKEMHKTFETIYKNHPAEFKSSLPALIGFGSHDILQLIYFHDFPELNGQIDIHSYDDLRSELDHLVIKPFDDVSSVEFSIGRWDLQVRVKPMNKFTTTAIKINCSVRVKRSSAS